MEECLASFQKYLEIVYRLNDYSMRRNLIINTLKAVFVFCFVGAEQPQQNDAQSFPVEISVYDGQGSLLIDWTFPETILPNQFNLFVKESGQVDFELLAVLPPDQTKYLDLNCDPNIRYFYKLEIEDMFGELVLSDILTPAFGTCLPVEDSLAFKSTINSMDELVLFEIKLKATLQNPDLNFDSILGLFSTDKNAEHAWFETIRVEQLKQLELPLQLLDDIIQNESLMTDLSSYELLMRNHLFHSPDSWEDELVKTVMDLKVQWNKLYDVYPFVLKRLDSIAPIRLVGYYIDDEYEKNLECVIFHPEQLSSSEIFLLSGEEYIDLGDHLMENKSNIMVPIPKHWNTVDLMMDNIFIQSVPTLFEISVRFTLEGDIIPLDTTNLIKVGRIPTELWLNELTWDPYQRHLRLEITGETDFEEQYSININEEPIWDIEPMSGFGIQFRDSSLTVSDEIEFPILVTFLSHGNETSSTIEYLLLDSLPMAINRIPDGGTWQYSESTTLGMTNEPVEEYFKTDLLPELFVLYQNYPNPFNGQTRISFDLLDDATVTLYITDATGRIHDKFMEREFMTSGSYHYNWQGEGRSTGIYFFTIHAQVDNRPPAIFSRKMIYLK